MVTMGTVILVTLGLFILAVVLAACMLSSRISRCEEARVWPDDTRIDDGNGEGLIGGGG